MKIEWNFIQSLPVSRQGSQETSATYYPQDALRLPVGSQGSLAGAGGLNRKL
jgi:hypothetical protein